MSRTGPEWMVERMIDCCVDCSSRNPGCHGRCEEYLRQREEHEAERAAIQRAKKMDGDAYLYTRETKCKLRRKSRVKGK